MTNEQKIIALQNIITTDGWAVIVEHLNEQLTALEKQLAYAHYINLWERDTDSATATVINNMRVLPEKLINKFNDWIDQNTHDPSADIYPQVEMTNENTTL